MAQEQISQRAPCVFSTHQVRSTLPTSQLRFGRRFLVPACACLLFSPPIDFESSILVWIIAGKDLVLFLSHRIKRLEDSWFKSFSRGDFPTRPPGVR
jgi:hypothetical protein